MGGAGDTSWQYDEEIALLLVVSSKRGLVKWADANTFVPNKNNSQCNVKWNRDLRKWQAKQKIDLMQALFVIALLKKQSSLWQQWKDICYVVSCYEYNHWNAIHRREQAKNRKKAELAKLMREKLNVHRYVDPAVIATFCCLIFGGKDGNRLLDSDYCAQITKLFKELKDVAIECQNKKLSTEQREEKEQKIEDKKKEIESFVNHKKFSFDAYILNVIDCIYLDDSRCHCYKMYKEQSA